MPSVDVVDETYVARPPEALAPRFADEALRRAWFPELELRVFMDRGEKGVRWSVSGPVTGSLEVWLEGWSPELGPGGEGGRGPDPVGTIVHWYLRVDPVQEQRPGRLRRLRTEYARRIKRRMFLLKDEAEGVRPSGAALGDVGV